MAMVPYNPYADVAPSVQPLGGFTQRPEVSPNTSAAAFGMPVAAGLKDAADTGTQAVLAWQGLQNETLATDAQTAAVKGAADLYGKYSNNLGQKAEAALPAFKEQLDQLRQTTFDGLPNPQAQRMFDQQFRHYQNSLTFSAAHHAATETKNWQIQAPMAAAQNWADQAVTFRNDPTKVALYIATGAGYVENSAQVRGWDKDQTQAAVAAWKGQAYSSIITTMMTDNPTGAKALFDQVAPILPGHVVSTLSRELDPRVRGAVANSWTDGNGLPMPGAGGPVGLSAAIEGVESDGGRDNSTSVNGARGPRQIMPATFSQFAHPGENIDNPADNRAVGDRIIATYANKYGGDAARVAVAYFSGPGNVAPAGSATPWLADKKDGNGQTVSGYVAKVMGRMGISAASGPPDVAGLTAKAVEQFGDNPRQLETVLSVIHQRNSVWNALTIQDRSKLNADLSSLKPALLSGGEFGIPEDRIRALMPPDQAQATIRDLHLSQVVGEAAKSLQWATPQEQADMLANFGDPQNIKATLMRARLARTGILDASAADPAAPESPEAFNLRSQMLKMLGGQVAANNQALHADPASYAAADQNVAALAARIDPANPQSFQDYATATVALQKHLGVADHDTRVLTVPQAKGLASKLVNADPRTADIGGQIDALSQTYGEAFPQAWHDLVKAGLPGEWQILGTIPAGPNRIAAQRAFQIAAAKGGVHKMAEDMDPTMRQQIDQNLPDALKDFTKSVMIPNLQSDAELVSSIRNGLRTLAMFNGLNGQDAGTALENAKKTLLDYDFEGTDGRARAPRGMGRQASAYAGDMLDKLTAQDIAPFNGGMGMTADARNSAMLNAIRRNATWVTNNRGDGWVAYLKNNDGEWSKLTRFDGQQIGFKFSDMAGWTAPTPAWRQVIP